MQAGEFLRTDLEHLVKVAEATTQAGQHAIEWAEEYVDQNSNFDLEHFRAVAYDQACNYIDPQDDCPVDCDETEFECEVLIATYVLAAIDYVIQHTVQKPKIEIRQFSAILPKKGQS